MVTMEGWQLCGVGGDKAGGDAAPVAAADDGHSVPAVGVPVLHLPCVRPAPEWQHQQQEEEAVELATGWTDRGQSRESVAHI